MFNYIEEAPADGSDKKQLRRERNVLKMIPKISQKRKKRLRNLKIHFTRPMKVLSLKKPCLLTRWK